MNTCRIYIPVVDYHIVMCPKAVIASGSFHVSALDHNIAGRNPAPVHSQCLDMTVLDSYSRYIIRNDRSNRIIKDIIGIIKDQFRTIHQINTISGPKKIAFEFRLAGDCQSDAIDYDQSFCLKWQIALQHRIVKGHCLRNRVIFHGTSVMKYIIAGLTGNLFAVEPYRICFCRIRHFDHIHNAVDRYGQGLLRCKGFMRNDPPCSVCIINREQFRRAAFGIRHFSCKAQNIQYRFERNGSVSGQ